MKKLKLYATLIAFVLTVVSIVQLVRHYTGMAEKELGQKLENLALVKQGGQKTMAHYDSTYTRHKGTNDYSIYYTYTVNGKQYRQVQQLNTTPTGDDQEVYYLPTDPSFTSFDPEADYNACKKELEEEKHTPTEAWGMLAVGLVASVLLVNSYMKVYREAREMAEYRRKVLPGSD